VAVDIPWYKGRQEAALSIAEMKGDTMQMVKIRIPNKEESARATVEMARRGRVDCYADQVYIVPESALELLKNMGVTYQELERGGIDYAEKALRDTLATQAQRRPSGQPRKVPADA
jgi:hypothetical protein